MDINSIMAKNVADLQHAVGLALAKKQMQTSAAQATAMMETITASQPPVPHPTAGKFIDVSA